MHPYQGIEVAFATKHQKAELVSDAFHKALNISVITAGIDTDLFGTFSGEMERKSSPLDTAIATGKAGAVTSGSNFGLASEGSIGNDSLIPFAISDIEIMVFVDLERELIIHESYKSFDIAAHTALVKEASEISKEVEKFDLPKHKVIAKVKSQSGAVVAIKGLSDLAELVSAFEELLPQAIDNVVTFESDFRAQCSPSRQANIKEVASRLLKRISNLCPGCNAPGFGVLTFERGLICNSCGVLNDKAIKNEILNCVVCDYSTPGQVIAEKIEPAHCMNCNP
jgi:hypothetical protein